MTPNLRSYVSVAALAAGVSLGIVLLAFSLRGHIIREYLANNPEDLQRLVKDYLVNNPTVLQQAIAEYVRDQQGNPNEPTVDRAAAIQGNAQLLFNSPRQVILGNPDGDVTLVEFFDYNCPYCRRGFGDVLTLMKDDPKLKIVLKEFPILSPASAEVAQVAVAVRMQDPAGQKYLAFRLKLIGERGQANKEIAIAAAKEVGLDMERLTKDMASDEVSQTLAESLQLARALGIEATPCYVVGDAVVLGAVGADALKEKIQLVRDRVAK